MSKIAMIVFILLPLCSSVPPCAEQSSGNTNQPSEQSNAATVKKDSSLQIEKKQSVTDKTKKIAIAKTMAQELMSSANIYESSFGRPIPSCGECSDLELLLFLERANAIHLSLYELLAGAYAKRSIVPQIEVPYVTKDKTLENELAGMIVAYKKRFGKESPWWWVCSDEEKLARLKQSLAIGIAYSEYGGSRGEIDYRLGKAIATYEMWFKRPPPKQDRSENAWLARLERAVNAESPLLTKEEETALKAEHVKKFKQPITSFESSIVKVSLARVFRRRLVYGRDAASYVVEPCPQTSVIRTTTGATALYEPSARPSRFVSINPGSTEVAFSTEDWLDFTSALHKYIGTWGNINCKNSDSLYKSVDYYWELTLFFANMEPKIFQSYNKCPIGWEELVEFMGGIETKIKNEGVQRYPPKINVEHKRSRIQGGIPYRRETLKTAKNPIAAGSSYAIGVKPNGTVVITERGWLSDSLKTWNNIVAVSVGKNHQIVGLKSNNTVIAIGSKRSDGQFNVANWKDIVAVSAGGYHTLGLRSTGTVVATGFNFDGQCDIADWSDMVAISAGGSHTLGLRADGTVMATGANSSNQCDVDDWDGIVAISAGRFHSVGLKSNGTVVAIGRDWGGMCSKTQHWDNIIAIATGDFHTVGLRSDGTVLAVGDNADDQCNVSKWKNIIAIAASNELTIGLRSDGTAVLAGKWDFTSEAVSGWSGLDTTGVRVSR